LIAKKPSVYYVMVFLFLRKNLVFWQFEKA